MPDFEDDECSYGCGDECGLIKIDFTLSFKEDAWEIYQEYQAAQAFVVALVIMYMPVNIVLKLMKSSLLYLVV